MKLTKKLNIFDMFKIHVLSVNSKFDEDSESVVKIAYLAMIWHYEVKKHSKIKIPFFKTSLTFKIYMFSWEITPWYAFRVFGGVCVLNITKIGGKCHYYLSKLATTK